MYLLDGELAMIPARVAQRASRIGYRVKSYITWNKDSTPEHVKSGVTRQAEVILHLTPGETPYFDKSFWPSRDARLGGSNAPYESAGKITDVWHLPTANGKNGHGAEFAVLLAGRCISLTSKPGDLVLDPFVGSGTSALAAMELGRRCVGFDTSQTYLTTAKRRVKAVALRVGAQGPVAELPVRGVNGTGPDGWKRLNGSHSADMLPIEMPTSTPKR